MSEYPTAERVIIDPSGYSLTVSTWPKRTSISGVGPRGGDSGGLEVRSEDRAELSAALEEMAEILESGSGPCTPVHLPAATAIKAMIGPGLWLYLRGPRNGYRRPMVLESPETLRQAAQLVAQTPGS